MKRIVCSLAILLSGLAVYAQQTAPQIPSDIHYKTAFDSDNAKAKSALERSLSQDVEYPKDLFGDTVTCGALLWADLKGSADESLLQAKVVSMELSVPQKLHTWGRGLITDAQRQAFWKELRAKYPALKTATVRKSNTAEIRFFWSTIFFDIEEPLYTIEAGQARFVANFRMVKGKPELWWIDRVGDLATLRGQVPNAAELKELLGWANAGMPSGMYQAGMVYLTGRGAPVDIEKGRTWLERSSDAGSLEAQMMLGMAYFSGKYLVKDQAAAAKYLQLAAAQGDPMAEWYVGLMYHHGIGGLVKSDEKAVRFFQLAADQNHPPAEYDLGVMYSKGLGVAADGRRACNLFGKASEQGHAAAMPNLSKCYELAGDWENSYLWARLAEEKAPSLGQTSSAQIKTHLTPLQVEAGETKVQDWLKRLKSR